MSGWIKKGMPVCSMTNLDQVMVVEDFVYKTGRLIGDDGQPYPKKFLIGIRCSYFDASKERHYEIVHSKELVPGFIASKGLIEAYRFYSREGEYSDY